MTTDQRRDPRIDPQPGDCVEKYMKAGTIQRTVVGRRGYDIFYRQPTAIGGIREHNCWITTWQEWCRDAQVTKIA